MKRRECADAVSDDQVCAILGSESFILLRPDMKTQGKLWRFPEALTGTMDSAV
jgi:hypothetical protein